MSLPIHMRPEADGDVADTTTDFEAVRKGLGRSFLKNLRRVLDPWIRSNSCRNHSDSSGTMSGPCAFPDFGTSFTMSYSMTVSKSLPLCTVPDTIRLGNPAFDLN